ncbi:putative archaea-specific Superfamily II helicase [Trichinella spiralis]|uniref:putative archaea-specific Superfamily II helicase n=1 Tax=Trichinella spiralis TaxID=6334 RepID=UPI0001EFEBCF|nr:putative archaea-specific Superfamily II helicase [Trichinella spiralis]
MLIKRCFPWRRPLTTLGPPEDAVVCACHRCAGCTRTKSTRTELLNLCQSLFGAIRRMYHELREKDAVLQNVEDPNIRKRFHKTSHHLRYATDWQVVREENDHPDHTL